MKYSELNRIEFNNVKDFDPVHIFECGQVFRWLPEVPAADIISDSAAGACDGHEAIACKESAITESGNPERSCTVYTGVAGAYAARVSYEEGRLIIEASGGDRDFWHDYFDLATDYGEIKRTLAENEPKIKEATEYGAGIRILNQNIFETIISFIISQNNNIPRIRKNIESICERYGEEIGEIEGRMIYAFPAPEALADAEVEDLASLKLGYRSEYIKESARQFIERGCPACREELLAMHGVGPKVANCIMLFGLKDMEAFPLDTWVRHIMNDLYGHRKSSDAAMYKTAKKKFGKYAGYAQQYLFYYYRDKSLKNT